MKNRFPIRMATIGAASAALLSGTALTAAADEALADLVEQVAPSVVTIIATQDPKQHVSSKQDFDLPEKHPFNEFFRQFGAPDKMPERFGQGKPAQGLGSGFIVDAEGWIVTNNHVVEDAETVTVRLNDNTEYEAEVIGLDALTDLALLRIDADIELTAVTLGDSDAIRVGEDVIAVGNPFGLGGTVTTGIVSAKGRNISEGPYAEFLQTDAAINKGNSGGPLFNSEGEVVGVNSAIYSPSGGSVGLGFAVTSNIAQDIIADLREDGQVDRGWLGVSIQSINTDIATAMGLDKAEGALVTDVVPDSPADGTLRTGDVIVSFDGSDVTSSADLPRLVGATDAGSQSKIQVIRDGKDETLSLTIGEFQQASAEMPDGAAEEAPASMLGATVAPLTDAARHEVGVDGKVAGVVVTSLADTGPAARAGLRVGDVIVKLGGQETSTPEDLKAALQSENTDPALMLINRGGNQIFVTVRLT